MAQSVIDNILEGIGERVRGARLIDWIHASPGIVVNETVAKATPCTCYPIPSKERPDAKICFSKGIIGALKEGQRAAYCTSEVDVEDGISKRVEKFREASDVCVEECKVLPKGTRLECRLKCMSRELEKRGIEV